MVSKIRLWNLLLCPKNTPRVFHVEMRGNNRFHVISKWNHVLCLYGGRCSSENSFYSLHMYYEDTSLRRLLLVFGSENYVFVNDWYWCWVLRYIVTLEWYSVVDFIWTTLDGFYTTYILLKLSIMHLAVHKKNICIVIHM